MQFGTLGRKFLWLLIFLCFLFRRQDVFSFRLRTEVDTTTTLALIEKAIQFSTIQDTTSALQYFRKALQKADSSSSFKDQADIFNKMGDLYYRYGQFKKAYWYYTQAQRLAAGHEFIKEEAKSLKGLAHIEWRTGGNVQSVNNILSSIEKFKMLQDTAGIIDAYDILGSVYVSMSKLDAANDIYKSMQQLAGASDDSVRLAQTHEHLGIVSFFNKDYKAAITAYKKSLSINQALNREVQVGINYANIGEALDYQNKHEEALGYFKRSLEILEENHFNSGLVFTYYALGRCHTHLGELAIGIRNYKRSLKYIKQTGEIREKPQVYELMADNYTRQGDYQKAFLCYKQRTQVKDSIDNMDKNNQIENIRAKYEIKEKERKNAELLKANEQKQKDLQDTQKIVFLQSASLILLLALIALFAYQYTKIKRQKELLKKADNTKDQLFNVISHDLRGPMGNLKSITDLIIEQEPWDRNEELKKVFSSVNNDINKTFFLLNDLLDWAQSQKGGITLNKQKLDLNEEIDQTISLLKSNARQKQIEVINRVATTTFVKADKNILQTILRNLITNAIKFSKSGSQVIVEGKNQPDEGNYRIAVKDYGVGMNEEYIRQLFNNEIQSNVGTAGEKGVGIGLSLCKQFIEQSGGELRVDSQVDEGSIFYFTLPSSLD